MPTITRRMLLLSCDLVFSALKCASLTVWALASITTFPLWPCGTAQVDLYTGRDLLAVHAHQSSHCVSLAWNLANDCSSSQRFAPSWEHLHGFLSRPPLPRLIFVNHSHTICANMIMRHPCALRCRTTQRRHHGYMTMVLPMQKRYHRHFCASLATMGPRQTCESQSSWIIPSNATMHSRFVDLRLEIIM